MQRWIDKQDSTRWVEFEKSEKLEIGSSVLGRFYHKNGILLNRCYVPAKYILSEFAKDDLHGETAVHGSRRPKHR